MMIAAYRAARLNQRQIQRSAPGLPPCSEPAVTEPAPLDVDVAPAALAADRRPVSCEIVAIETSAVPALDLATDIGPPAHLGETGQTDMRMMADPPRSPREPDLSEIGLGPCMMIRLNQLGLRRARDVAQASPDDLRAALGGSSRLVNVEAWIANARSLTAAGSDGPPFGALVHPVGLGRDGINR